MEKTYKISIVILFFIIGLFMGFTFGFMVWQELLASQVERIVSAVEINNLSLSFDINFNQSQFIEYLEKIAQKT